MKASLDERETSGATWYRNFGVVLASQKGTEPKLLRKSPDQSRRRCDGGIRNSTLRFHVILILDMRTQYYHVKQSQLFLHCSRFNHICEQTRFTSQPLLICYEDLWIIISPLSVTWKVINFINNKILPIISYLVFQVMLFGPPLLVFGQLVFVQFVVVLV